MARNDYVSAHSTLYGTVTVSLRSGDGQVTFKSQSDRGKARGQSRSAHGQNSLRESLIYLNADFTAVPRPVSVASVDTAPDTVTGY